MPTPPDSTIQAFLDAIPSITSWSSPNIRDIYCDIIKWTDKDHKGAIEIAETYHELGNGNQDPTKVTVNRSANIYKLYDKWAPKFYQEKGVGFVSLRDRRKYSTVRGKNAVEGLTKKAKISKPKVNKGVGAVASKPLVEAREHSDTIPSQTPPHRKLKKMTRCLRGRLKSFLRCRPHMQRQKRKARSKSRAFLHQTNNFTISSNTILIHLTSLLVHLASLLVHLASLPVHLESLPVHPPSLSVHLATLLVHAVGRERRRYSLTTSMATMVH
jgi:hypothetical protein